MKITIFSEELRKCLNAAGLSDCGENDTWNYWYQRLMNAYNESVERRIMTEQTENEKLREQIHWLKQGDILHVLTDQEYIDQCERERLMQVSIDALDKENAKLRDLVRVLHVAHVGMVNRYKDNEIECIWEYGCDIENNIRKLESECEKECHRFDAAMRELGVEV